MIYALIQNGIVVNKIKADANFISTISNNYEHCVDITESETHPDINDLYDHNTQTFSKPVVEPVEPPPEVP